MMSYTLPSPLASTFPADRLSTVLVNLSAKKYLDSFGCHPLDGVTWGSPPPAPPPSDTTGKYEFSISDKLTDMQSKALEAV